MTATWLDCELIAVLSDGRLLLRIAGREQTVGLHGVAVAAEQSAAIKELMERFERTFRPLKCSGPAGGATRIEYLSRRDKSGDVWYDLAATLLEVGLAHVAAGEFPERAEYLLREREARDQGLGVWASGQP